MAKYQIQAISDGKVIRLVEGESPEPPDAAELSRLIADDRRRLLDTFVGTATLKLVDDVRFATGEDLVEMAGDLVAYGEPREVSK